MHEWIEITVTFSDGAAPEISVKTPLSHSFAATRAHYMCLMRVRKWQDEQAVCSVEWIEALVKDLKDGWTALRFRLRREQRRA
ncbi:unnamed protein product [Aureobasidium mustum]|uniref:Uncharacterized protein n=1 Tax=Aureobasidium mustum TaxID=2773714 RepID=A0A9N8K3I7_9PEZI|nr:unnamed protein product [Aureobasidium mustum]